MRNLVLLLIAFLAVITFIRAFDKVEAGTLTDRSPQEATVQTTVDGSLTQ